jgi:hypothetical protein
MWPKPKEEPERSELKQSFPARRQDGLKRLAEFIPQAGEHYKKFRNFDYGPENRTNISLLSPYIRHRLVSEYEVVKAVLQEHSLSASEKFIQEILWRTYWKGWLEKNPSVWNNYLEELKVRQSNSRNEIETAINGQTGIDCFDFWVQELKDTGYLHNHARMWFASIWVFTLKLPWVLGADFFYRHLLDADPASNTLSWRWVAGLQTKGKFYAASESNINQFTEGRFSPKGLARPFAGISEQSGFKILDSQDKPLQSSSGTPPWEECAFWLHEDDLSLEQEFPQILKCQFAFELQREIPTSKFTQDALVDARQRLQSIEQAVLRLEEISQELKDRKIMNVVAARPTIGNLSPTAQLLEKKLKLSGGKIYWLRRSWDQDFYPLADRGYFPFKEKAFQKVRSYE